MTCPNCNLEITSGINGYCSVHCEEIHRLKAELDELRLIVAKKCGTGACDTCTFDHLCTPGIEIIAERDRAVSDLAEYVSATWEEPFTLQTPLGGKTNGGSQQTWIDRLKAEFKSFKEKALAVEAERDRYQEAFEQAIALLPDDIGESLRGRYVSERENNSASSSQESRGSE